MRILLPQAVLILVLSSAPAAARPDCGYSYSQFEKKRLERLVLSDSDRDLYDIQSAVPTPEDARVWNEALISALNSAPTPKVNPMRKNGVSRELAQELYLKMRNHPIAKGEILDRYDPDIKIGFCFGRALAAQIEALRMGIAKESIKKIWIVGRMTSSTTDWGHHVATMVRGLDGKWYVIDLLFDEPISIETWYRKIAYKYENDGRLQLFASNAKRFGPGGGVNAQAIKPSTVKDPYYNYYFEDMMAYSRQEARATLEKRKKAREKCSPTQPDSNKFCLQNLLKAILGP